ncbi:MAG: glycosyltransferase family 4 protein [Bacteroidales bacterium]|nr:glycosyltransferase family 4 protein [Bacteroidales bacterium]
MKPKVLVISSSYPKHKGDVNGGFVYDLSSRLKNEFDVHVLAPFYKGALAEEISDEIKIHRHKQFTNSNIELAYGIGIYENLKKNKLKYLALPFYFLYLLISIIKITKSENIKIVHAHWIIPNAFAAVICKKIFRCRFKIAATIHGSDIWGFDNVFGNMLKKIALRNIDELSVVSNAIKNKVIEFGYRKNINVIPMGVDTMLFVSKKENNDIRKKYNANGFLILFVGIIVEQKGIRNLIKAVPHIIKEYAETKFVVVGDGNLKNEMIALSKELDVEKNIIFTGTISHDELPKYYSSSDLFVLPSLSEGFGLVIAEAMSCSTIAIATNLPVIQDIITENKNGFYFENTTSESISNKICSILGNIDKYSYIKENGRQHIANNFDLNVIAGKYASLLNNLHQKL